MTKLITIPFSHFCEKARWALERCDIPYEEDGHLPLFHYAAVRRAGGQRTVPLLVHDGVVIADSTPIVEWADARRPGELLPANARDRATALALEDEIDRQLGPAARRFAYFHMLGRRDLEELMMTRHVPRWQVLALRATRPVAVSMLKRGLKLDEAGAERSRKKVDEMFARVGELLADGRRFLVGGRFSVADLTFASLAAPVLMPREFGVALPSVDAFTGAVRDQFEIWRASRAGLFALRLYATERTRRAA